MHVKVTKDMKLALWVKDEGLLEGYTVYMDGNPVHGVADALLHRYHLKRCADGQSIVVDFGGRDGGKSAIVVDKGEQGQLILAKNEVGMRHEYVLQF